MTLFSTIEYIEEKYGLPSSFLKLNLILYYCKAWHLAWNKDLLFRNIITAEIYGVSIENLTEVNILENSKFYYRNLVDFNYLDFLNDYEKNTIDVIIESVQSKYTTDILNNLKTEDPYLKAINKDYSRMILESDMFDYYSQLA